MVKGSLALAALREGFESPEKIHAATPSTATPMTIQRVGFAFLPLLLVVSAIAVKNYFGGCVARPIWVMPVRPSTSSTSMISWY
jgi:hypothetical protein